MNYQTKGIIGSCSIVSAYLALVISLMAIIVSFSRPTPQAKPLNAFIIVNEHDGLSDWGLEQLDKLLKENGNE